MSNIARTCPVCGAPQQNLSSTTCKACGCVGAFYTLFSGEKAYGLWKATIDRQRDAKKARLYLDSRDAGCLLQVTANSVCFHDPKTGKAVICNFEDSTPTVLKNVKQIALCSLYQLVLHPDGTVSSSGDDYYNQRSGLSRISNAAFVAAARTCSYIVTEDGSVIEQGMNDFSGVPSGWKDIRRVSANQVHIVGLRKDGTVVYAMSDNSILRAVAQEMDSWTNVKDVVVADRYILALHTNGTVSYLGVQKTKAAVAQWRKIVSIAADSQYAIGLTEDGEVLLAGEESPFVDYGRKNAKQWKNIAFVAAGDSMIIGLNSRGALQSTMEAVMTKDFESSFTGSVRSLLQQPATNV